MNEHMLDAWATVIALQVIWFHKYRYGKYPLATTARPRACNDN